MRLNEFSNERVDEYGMSAGSASYGSNAVKTAASKAKNFLTTPVGQSKSPSTQPVQNKPVTVQANKLKQDDEIVIPGQNNKPMKGKVVSPAGKRTPNIKNDEENTVTVQNDKGEFITFNANDNLEIPQVAESRIGDVMQNDSDRLLRTIRTKEKKLAKLIRASKYKQQGEPLYEINFNNAQVMKSALDAPISCGFEAETYWGDIETSEIDDDWLVDKDWDDIESLLYEQYYRTEIDRLTNAWEDAVLESDEFNDALSDKTQQLVSERKEDEYYINDFVSEQVSDSDIEEYKEEVMDNLDEEDEEYQERLSWDDDAWGREYVDENLRDEYIEWLEQDINDNGEAFDDAVEKAREEYNIDTWMQDVYGNWYSCLSDFSLDLYPTQEGGSVEDVAIEVEKWAKEYSTAKSVISGGYHDNSGIDNDFWRVEEDSSLDSYDVGAPAEVISPVYSTPRQMLIELNDLLKFMQKNNVTTDNTTGFHVTMSLDSDQASTMSPLKLAILLGDKYILQQFGRDSNSYAKSQLDNLRKAVDRMTQSKEYDPKDFAQIESILTRGLDMTKFTSINFKQDRNSSGNSLVEFRIGGGDDYHTDFEKISKAVVKYAVTLQAAHDPDAYKEDYIKAIYKLINTVSNGVSDAELAAAPGVELPNSLFVDLYKTVYKKDHTANAIIDKLEQLSIAYKEPGSDRAYGLFGAFIANMADSITNMNPRTVRSIKIGMKELGLTDPKVIWDNIRAALSMKYHSSTEEVLATVRNAFNTQLGFKIKGPEGTINIKSSEDFVMPKSEFHKAYNNKEFSLEGSAIVPIRLGRRIQLALNLIDLNVDPEREPSKHQVLINKMEMAEYNPKTVKDAARQLIDMANKQFNRKFTDDDQWLTANDTRMLFSKNTAKQYTVVVQESTTLENELRLVEGLDKHKLNQAHKRLLEGKRVVAEQVPQLDTPTELKAVMSKPLLGSDLQGQMRAFAALPSNEMLSEFRATIAELGAEADLRHIVKKYLPLVPAQEKKQIGITESKLTEARGVAARKPGETYVNVKDSSDILTLQSVTSIPEENSGVAETESLEDLQNKIAELIPDNAITIEDNKPNASVRAAIIALVQDSNGNDQYWIRYIKRIPPSGLMGTWKTLNGYKYSKGAATESVPIKPSDLIKDDAYRDINALTSEIQNNLQTVTNDVSDAHLIDVMHKSLEGAHSGESFTVPGGAKYFNVLQKYAGEFLGPINLIAGNTSGGDTEHMLQAYELTSLDGAQVKFPQSVSEELVDSYIKTPNGLEIGVSSKIHQGGGAASSLLGIYKKLTDEMKQQHPEGAEIIEILATQSAVNGPISLGMKYDVITHEDMADVKTLLEDRSIRDINAIQSEHLRSLIQNQSVQDGVTERNDYRVLFHLLAAIVNQLTVIVNDIEDFRKVVLLALNNNNFVQLTTKGTVKGDDVVMDFYTKFPAVYEGYPMLFNKSYFATGQKGRLGFKMVASKPTPAAAMPPNYTAKKATPNPSAIAKAVDDIEAKNQGDVGRDKVQ